MAAAGFVGEIVRFEAQWVPHARGSLYSSDPQVGGAVGPLAPLKTLDSRR